MPAGSGTGTSAFRSALGVGTDVTPLFVAGVSGPPLGYLNTAPANVGVTLPTNPIVAPAFVPSAGVRNQNTGQFVLPPLINTALPLPSGPPLGYLTSAPGSVVPQYGGPGSGVNAQVPGSPVRSVLGSAPVPQWGVTPIGDQTTAGPVGSLGAFLQSPTGLILALGGIVLLAVLMQKKGK